MANRLDTSDREALRPSDAVHAVINASTELTDREKRVYLADLYWWMGPEGSWISAAHLGKRLGIPPAGVEEARRSLVAMGLQIVFDRPTGKTAGRICILPPGTDPGPRTPAEDCQAYAILLDNHLRRQRGPAPATPPEEGSGRVAPRGSETPLPTTPRYPPNRRGVQGIPEGIGEVVGRVFPGGEKGPRNALKTTPDYPTGSEVAEGSRRGAPRGEIAPGKLPRDTRESGGVAQGSAAGVAGEGGGVGGGGLNLPDLRSKSLSSLKIEKKVEKREGPNGPEEERGGAGEREGVPSRTVTPPEMTASTGLPDWRAMLTKAGAKPEVSE